MTLLKKILGLFSKNAGSDSTEEYQAQFKLKINANNVSTPQRNEGSPASSGVFDVIVVGVSFYQDVLKKICDNKRADGTAFFKEATIVSYDDNPHDAHAVRVEIDGATVGHLGRKNAIIWRSKMISDYHSGAVRCPAKIVWDRSYDSVESYCVWLDLDLTLPDSNPEPNVSQARLASNNQTDHIEFLVKKLNRFELSNCKAGDNVNLWVAEEAREIFIYMRGAPPGEGKIGVCPDELFKTIRNAPECDATIASIYEGGCKIACRLISKAEMAERLKSQKNGEKKRQQNLRKDLTTPVVYSPLNEDIYTCFISNKTGMCDNIGNLEQFRDVEERIARICQEKKGRYYKSQAKKAKFAIIFDPAARTLSNASKLKKAAYKVTTFEKALEHFALTEFWDCKKLMKAEKENKKEVYEIKFGKPFPLSHE